MSLEKQKIVSYADNIKSLSNYPSADGISPEELKAMFDGRTDKEVRKSINGIIDELISSAGADQIGSREGNVQSDLDRKANRTEPTFNKEITVLSEDEEGIIRFIPSAFGGEAEMKICDVTGICAGMSLDYDGRLKVSYGNQYIQEKENEGVVYSTLTHPDLDLQTASLTPEAQNAICRNLGISDEVSTGRVKVGTCEIRKDGTDIVISRPMEETVPGSELVIGYDLMFSHGEKNEIVYHSGNLKDLTEEGMYLGETEKSAFMANTGLGNILGDVNAALEGILALQESYIGGEE